MQPIQEALSEVKDIYRKVMGRPAPELGSASCFSFPPGVDPIEYAVNEVDQLRQFSPRARQATVPTWIPYADCFRKQDEFVARLEVSGIPREDLQVLFEGGDCVVRGERKPPEEDLDPLALERPWGPFERRFGVPAGIEQEHIRARCLNGILEINIPISKGQSDTKQIEVK